MTARKDDSPHPQFVPRDGMDTLATRYMLWAISRKCFLKPSGCWYFSGRRNDGGYGIILVGQELYRVHRIIYEHCVADIPDGLLVLHDCDRPPCCNPAHLHLGDKQQNMIECLERTRNHSAILTPEVVREIRRVKAGGGTSVKRLAERFGVSADAIGEVLNGKTWGFVQ